MKIIFDNRQQVWYCVLLSCICISSLYALFEYDRGISAAQKGNMQAAQELLTASLIDHPERPDTLYDLGVIAYKAQDHQRALAYFTGAADTESTSATLKEQAHFNAGNCQVALKQLEQALAQYDKALAYNPSNKQALHNKELVKRMLEQQKKEEQQKQQQKKSSDDAKDSQDHKKNSEKSESSDTPQKSSSPDESQSNNPADTNPETDKPTPSSENISSADQDQKHTARDNAKKENGAQPTASKPKASDKNSADQSKPSQSSAHAQSKNAPHNQSASQKSSHDAVLSPGLVRLLENQEQKDAALTKKLMRAHTHQGASHEPSW